MFVVECGDEDQTEKSGVGTNHLCTYASEYRAAGLCGQQDF